jgi:D-arabinose 1-dehydrogenase-like Zn-dependent alcohol dehydrogenase
MAASWPAGINFNWGSRRTVASGASVVREAQAYEGKRSVQGAIIGSPYDIEKTLRFCAPSGVRPEIDVMPLADANLAYQKMKSGDVKFRMVLTMKSQANAQGA